MVTNIKLLPSKWRWRISLRRQTQITNEPKNMKSRGWKLLLIIEILRLVHGGLAQQAPKATTHVWGLGVARHRVLIDCNGEHRDRAQDRGVWVVRTKYGKQLAAGAKILNAFVTTRARATTSSTTMITTSSTRTIWEDNQQYQWHQQIGWVSSSASLIILISQVKSQEQDSGATYCQTKQNRPEKILGPHLAP